MKIERIQPFSFYSSSRQYMSHLNWWQFHIRFPAAFIRYCKVVLRDRRKYGTSQRQWESAQFEHGEESDR